MPYLAQCVPRSGQRLAFPLVTVAWLFHGKEEPTTAA
jgi:hypothetical protein